MYYSSGNYEAFATPKKPEGVEHKSAYLIAVSYTHLVTLDVYTHSSFESVERAFEQIAGNL